MSRKKTTVKAEIHMHPILWKWISQEDLTKLEQMSPEQVEKHIADIMNLENYKTDLKHGALVDFYVSNYWWAAKNKRYTNEQTSIFFGIANVLLENLREKHLTLAENFSEFKTHLSQINQNVKLFNDTHINDIMDYICVSLFQHYKMYEYLFFNFQDDYVVSKDIAVEVPVPPELPYPPPLDEALPEGIYNEYILKIRNEPEPKNDQDIIQEQIAQIEIPTEIEKQIKTMFDGLTIEEAKNVIYEVTNDIIADLKIDMRKSLKEREANLINEIGKLSAKSIKH